MKGPFSSRRILPIALLAGLAAAAHGGSVRNGFVNWDDPSYVTDNIRIQNPNKRNLLDILNPALTPSDPFPEYHPVRDLSFALDFRIWRNQAFGYHLTNVLLHAANSALFYLLFLRLFASAPTALFAASLFACHPAHVESVAWVSSRKDVLACLFFLLSALTFFRATEKTRPPLASAVFFALALLSKSQVIGLPFVLIFQALWKGDAGTRSRKSALNFAPLFLLAVAFGGFFVSLQFSSVSVSQYYEAGFEPNPAAIVQIFGRYLATLLLPLDICPYYDLKSELKRIDPAFFLSSAAASAFLAALLLGWRKRSPVAPALAAYFIFLAPTLKFLPHPIWLADRYLYFPAPFFYWVLGHLLGRALRRTPRTVPWALAAAAVVILTSLSRVQTTVWRDGESLWRRVLESYPNAVVARVNLGQALREKGRFAQAREQYEKAVRLAPSYGEARMALTALRMELGHYASARAQIARLQRTRPGDPAVSLLAGNLDLLTGNPAGAAAAYREALERAPGLLEARHNLAQAYKKVERFDAARAELERCLAFRPTYADCRYALGNLYATAFHDLVRAEDHLLRAHELRPAHAATLYDLGVLYARQGRSAKAVSYLRRALAADPSNENAAGARRFLAGQAPPKQ